MDVDGSCPTARCRWRWVVQNSVSSSEGGAGGGNEEEAAGAEAATAENSAYGGQEPEQDETTEPGAAEADAEANEEVDIERNNQWEEGVRSNSLRGAIV